jgi:hypothetical protein
MKPTKVKFPSKKAFELWWDNKRDNPKLNHRHVRCPIARYLHAQGAKGISIGSEFAFWNGLTKMKELPKWATEFIKDADGMKHSYRGWPKHSES